ncbi:MAG: methyltransferase [Candidatus Zixiibacteriota bacterium]
MHKQNNLDNTSPSPEAALGRMIGGFMVTQMIYVATKLGIADLLKDGPKGVNELVESAGAHPEALYRLMRGLASTGIFAETDDRQFELTPLATLLQAGVPGSMRNFALWAGEALTWKPFGELLHSVKTGKPAFKHVFGMGIMDYLAGNAEASQIFTQVMTERAGPTAAAVCAAYDFSRINKLVDVGGGHGILITTILRANPHLRGVVFDVPSVVEGAAGLIEREGVGDRCEVVPGDFFESVPVVGDAYILSSVIHDWDDDHALTILKNIHQNMPKDGRLLLVEYVIQPGNDPFPGKISDIIMLVTENGLERTEAEFRALLGKAGFKLIKIIQTQSPMSVIEGTPVH